MLCLDDDIILHFTESDPKSVLMTRRLAVVLYSLTKLKLINGQIFVVQYNCHNHVMGCNDNSDKNNHIYVVLCI